MPHGRVSGGRFDLAAYWRYLCQRGYARSTRAKRIAAARSWLAFRRGELAGATHRDVERWAHGRGLTPSSTRNLMVDLRGLYRWAMREGIVDADPTQLVDRPRVPMRLPRPAPERDIARVLAVGDVQVRALVALMACAGLRCVECSRLDWRDVDLQAATVIVDGKGSKERLVDLSPDVVRALAALALASPGRLIGAVFHGPSGARLSPARVSQRVARAFAELGIDTRAHQLRHRCATMALRQPGVDLLAVRDLLGHVSISTTQVYTAVVPGRTALASRSLRLPTAASS